MLTVETEEKLEKLGKKKGTEECLEVLALTSGYLTTSCINANRGRDEKLVRSLASMFVQLYATTSALGVSVEVEAIVREIVEKNKL